MATAAPTLTPGSKSGAPPGPGTASADCFCKHSQKEHHAEGGACKECECRHYQPRPCTCRHAHDAHIRKNSRCGARGCSCKYYRQDDTAEFLLREGIRSGEWQFLTVPQLQVLMHPEQPDPTIRVWACLMLHSIGERRGRRTAGGRLAVKVTGQNQTEPLSPDDIVTELNGMDSIGRMTRQNMRRELKTLESWGAIRQTGKVKGHIRLFVYARPWPGRFTPKTDDLVVCTDYQNFSTDSKDDYLRLRLITPIRGSVVKSFSRELRLELNGHGDLVVQTDYQNLIAEAADRVASVVQAEYQKLLSVVCPAAPNKEDSTASSNEVKKEAVAAAASSSSASPQPPPQPASSEDGGPAPVPAPPAPDRPAGFGGYGSDLVQHVTEAMKAYVTNADSEAAWQVVTGCREVRPDSTDEEILHFTHKKGFDLKNQDGLRNPKGLLIRYVPKLLASELDAYRAGREAAQVAERQAAERQSELQAIRDAEDRQQQEADDHVQAAIAEMGEDAYRRRVAEKIKAITQRWPMLPRDTQEELARAAIRKELLANRVGREERNDV